MHLNGCILFLKYYVGLFILIYTFSRNSTPMNWSYHSIKINCKLKNLRFILLNLSDSNPRLWLFTQTGTIIKNLWKKLKNIRARLTGFGDSRAYLLPLRINRSEIFISWQELNILHLVLIQVTVSFVFLKCSFGGEIGWQ